MGRRNLKIHRLGCADLCGNLLSNVEINSWLTASDKIVKSLSFQHISYFFNTVKVMKLLFCKMTDFIEQNNFFCADFSLLSLILFLGNINILS